MAKSESALFSASEASVVSINDSARRPNLFSYVDTSSSDDDEYIQATHPRHVLKPPKYDGTTPKHFGPIPELFRVQ